jgi:hypothetical protein
LQFQQRTAYLEKETIRPSYITRRRKGTSKSQYKTYSLTEFFRTLSEMTPLILREVLLGNPKRSRPALSPEGMRIAYLAPNERVEGWHGGPPHY